MTIVKCRRCKGSVPGDYQNCPTCGYTVRSSSDVDGQPVAPVELEGWRYSREGRGVRRVMKWCLFVWVGLIVVGCAVRPLNWMAAWEILSLSSFPALAGFGSGVYYLIKRED